MNTRPDTMPATQPETVPVIELLAMQGDPFYLVGRNAPRSQSLYYALDTPNMQHLCRLFALKGKHCYPQLVMRSRGTDHQLREFEGMVPNSFTTRLADGSKSGEACSFGFTIDEHPYLVEVAHIHWFWEVLNQTVYVHVPEPAAMAKLMPYVRRTHRIPGDPTPFAP